MIIAIEWGILFPIDNQVQIISTTRGRHHSHIALLSFPDNACLIDQSIKLNNGLTIVSKAIVVLYIISNWKFDLLINIMAEPLNMADF